MLELIFYYIYGYPNFLKLLDKYDEIKNDVEHLRSKYRKIITKNCIRKIKLQLAHLYTNSNINYFKKHISPYPYEIERHIYKIRGIEIDHINAEGIKNMYEVRHKKK